MSLGNHKSVFFFRILVNNVEKCVFEVRLPSTANRTQPDMSPRKCVARASATFLRDDLKQQIPAAAGVAYYLLKGQFRAFTS